MQIVIDIPEEMYKWVNDVNKFSDDYGISDFVDLVKSGVPLPKDHGRLVDVDEGLKYCTDRYEIEYWNEEVPIVIEAENSIL